MAKSKEISEHDLDALAQTGALNAEIVAELGRPMTPQEDSVVRRGRLKWRQSRIKKREQMPDGGSWRAELDRLKCQLAEMEVAQKEGRLISSDDVLRMAQEDAAAIKTAMLGMPNALAPQLVGLKKIEAVKAILKDWVRSTLQGWHDSLQGGQSAEIDGGTDDNA